MNTRSEHTPGPWEARYGVSAHAAIYVQGTECNVAVGVLLRDANLIATAPKLLAATEAALAEIESTVGDFMAFGIALEDPEHPWHRTATQLRDAIAEARGHE